MISPVIYPVHFKHFLFSIPMLLSGAPLPSLFPILPLLVLMCDYQVGALQSEIDRSADMYKLPLMMCLSGQIAGASRQAFHLQRSSIQPAGIVSLTISWRTSISVACPALPSNCRNRTPYKRTAMLIVCN